MLPPEIAVAARNVIKDKVIAHKQTIQQRRTKELPYYLNDEGSMDAEVAQLVQLRWDSEMFVKRHILAPKTKKTIRGCSAASPQRFNQIALLAMLGTKGSVTFILLHFF